MTTLLHPIGPEPEETYWKRRAVVLAAVVLVLLLLIWAISSLFNRSDDTGAVPVGQTTQAESSMTSPDPSVEPSMTESTLAGDNPSDSTTDTMPATESTTSADPTATASPTSTLPASTTPTSTLPSSTSASPSPTGPVVCTPAEVVPGITGATRVNTGRTVNLFVTLTSTANCVIDFGSAGFEIRIYSGADRIWSSNDCSTHQPSGRSTLAPGKAWGYTIEWNTKRSLGNCQLDTAFLLPGTYVATAVLSGGDPVQHVMTVLA